VAALGMAMVLAGLAAWIVVVTPVELVVVLGLLVVMAVDKRSHHSLGHLLTCSRLDAMLSRMSPAIAAAGAAAQKVLLLSALTLVALPGPMVSVLFVCPA